GIRIGLVGDHDASVTAHRAIPRAIALAAEALSVRAAFDWIATDAIDTDAPLDKFDAIWVVPASPYRSMDGALHAITFARTRGLPFLGTCAGFQHALIEHARSALGWADADHAETSPNAARPVVAALACSLVEASETLPRAGLAARRGVRCSRDHGTISVQLRTESRVRRRADEWSAARDGVGHCRRRARHRARRTPVLRRDVVPAGARRTRRPRAAARRRVRARRRCNRRPRTAARMTIHRATWSAAIVAVGIALGGLFAGNGFARGRTAERFVTVKGVAEREVKADLAIWPLHIIGADDNLAAANAKLAASVAGVRQFLAKHGIDTSQVQLSGFSVSDANANQFNAERRPGSRYVIHQTMIVRSTRPEQVLAASQAVSELAATGVAISSGNEYGPAGGGPTFVFSGLNTLKPTMIADATARA